MNIKFNNVVDDRTGFGFGSLYIEKVRIFYGLILIYAIGYSSFGDSVKINGRLDSVLKSTDKG